MDEQSIVFVAHEDPVGLSRKNYIVRVDLAPYELDGQMEQLYLRILDEDGGYAVACVPFCVYGLAYQDRVTLDSTGTYVGEVIAHSGHRVLRALLFDEADGVDVDAVRRRIERVVADLGLLREWRGGRHVAVDVPVGVDAAPLERLLAAQAAAGELEYEWGDREPFIPPIGQAADT